MAKILVIGNKGLTLDATECDYPVLVETNVALIDPEKPCTLNLIRVVVDWSKESYLKDYKVEVDYNCLVNLSEAFDIIDEHRFMKLPHSTRLNLDSSAPYVVLPEDYLQLIHEFMGDTARDEHVIIIGADYFSADWLMDMGFDAMYDNITTLDFEELRDIITELCDTGLENEHLRNFALLMVSRNDALTTANMPNNVFTKAMITEKLVRRIGMEILEPVLVDDVEYTECDCATPAHDWDAPHKNMPTKEEANQLLAEAFKQIYPLVEHMFDDEGNQISDRCCGCGCCEKQEDHYDKYLVKGKKISAECTDSPTTRTRVTNVINWDSDEAPEYTKCEMGRIKYDEYLRQLQEELVEDPCAECDEKCAFNESPEFKKAHRHYVFLD